MIDSAAFDYSKDSDTLNISLYSQGSYVSLINCEYDQFSLSFNPEFSSYWLRMICASSFISLQITQSVFDYLSESLAASNPRPF